GSFDLSYLRCLPNMAILAPSDEDECRQMLYTGFLHDGPCTVRYPRGTGPGVEPRQSMSELPWGRGELKRDGRRVALLCFGAVLPAALDAAEELDASVANMRFIKPLDETLIETLAQRHELLVTVEDNAVMGGAGSAVNECLARIAPGTTVLNLGLPDRYQDHGSREQLLSEAGLDAAGIVGSVSALLTGSQPGSAA
ncbi:MAG: transketolase C-terminal domain-containing protein, partial [Gammaproteobacteria bacterium]